MASTLNNATTQSRRCACMEIKLKLKTCIVFPVRWKYLLILRATRASRWSTEVQSELWGNSRRRANLTYPCFSLLQNTRREFKYYRNIQSIERFIGPLIPQHAWQGVKVNTFCCCCVWNYGCRCVLIVNIFGVFKKKTWGWQKNTLRFRFKLISRQRC